MVTRPFRPSSQRTPPDPTRTRFAVSCPRCRRGTRHRARRRRHSPGVSSPSRATTWPSRVTSSARPSRRQAVQPLGQTTAICCAGLRRHEDETVAIGRDTCRREQCEGAAHRRDQVGCLGRDLERCRTGGDGRARPERAEPDRPGRRPPRGRGEGTRWHDRVGATCRQPRGRPARGQGTCPQSPVPAATSRPSRSAASNFGAHGPWPASTNGDCSTDANVAGSVTKERAQVSNAGPEPLVGRADRQRCTGRSGPRRPGRGPSR